MVLAAPLALVLSFRCFNHLQLLLSDTGFGALDESAGRCLSVLRLTCIDPLGLFISPTAVLTLACHWSNCSATLSVQQWFLCPAAVITPRISCPSLTALSSKEKIQGVFVWRQKCAQNSEKENVFSLCVISLYCLNYCCAPLAVPIGLEGLVGVAVRLVHGNAHSFSASLAMLWSVSTGRFPCVTDPSVIFLQLPSKILSGHFLPDHANYEFKYNQNGGYNAEKQETVRQD